MEDLKFWRLLHEAPTVELVPFLEALAERPLKERVPYLGCLPALLQERQDPSLQQAALAALQGASGRRALQLMVDSLGHSHPAVASRALRTLALSIGHDPMRWAHAVFHPNGEIRRQAVSQMESTGLGLYLLGDQDCREHVRLPSRLPQGLAPTLLEWYDRGLVDRDQCRGLLHHQDLIWLLLQPESGRDVARMLSAFWDDLPPAPVLWKRLASWLETQARSDYRQPVAEVILELGTRLGSWPEAPTRLLFRLRPLALLDGRIPREDRYRGLETLYATQERSLPKSELISLLESDLVQTGDGVDLWALGALLGAAAKPHKLLESVPIEAISEGAHRDPLGMAFLFLSPRSPQEARQSLAQLLAKATRQEVAIAAGLLAVGDHLAAAPALANFPGQVAEAVFALCERPGFGPAPAAREKLVKALVEANRKTPVALLRGLRGDMPQDCLARLAETLGPESFLKECRRLCGEVLADLLETIDHTPSFPYAVEGLLVKELASHAHLPVQAWCAARTLSPAASQGKAPQSVRALSAEEQELIAGCSESELPQTLRPALKAPSLHLAEALASRTPDHNRGLVAQALMGCHDSMARVAEQWERYGPVSDNHAAAWSFQPDLPLHGHCRLDRFDFHTDKIEASTTSLRELLEMARYFGGPLSHALWRMVARLCSRWRFRNVPKLAAMVDEALVESLVQALEESSPRQAAIALARLWQAEVQLEALVRLRPRVQDLLPDLDQETRLELHGYVSSRGMLSPTVQRREKAGQGELELVRRCTSLEELSELAADPRSEIACEAALRLLDFAESGASILLQRLRQPAPQAATLAETAGLWPEGPSRRALLAMVSRQELPAEVGFLAGLSLLETGASIASEVLRAACRPSPLSWFRKAHWERLLRCGLSEGELSLGLATSPHPNAYTRAVTVALAQNQSEALVNFLESGWDRLAETRQSVARHLWAQGDRRGFPLIFQQALESPGQAPSLEGVDLRVAVDSAMLAGHRVVPEKGLVELLLLKLAPPDLATIAPIVLRQSRRPETCQALLGQLPRGERRNEMLTRVARTFLWGVKVGRQLTGRLFAVEMHGGEELGFTRLEESRIFVNPLPMFRGDRHGQEVVEGLILHELGHHIYHRGDDQARVWKEAETAGIFPLLNLVSDEHLERNLRASSVAYDKKLKRLAAYAFLHSRREVPITSLLLALGHKAAAVLTHTHLSVASANGHVCVRGADVLNALENHGSSFMRFVRALRTGRGNRHNDPLVAEALALFPSAFRGYSLRRQYEVAQELRRLFGRETDLIKALAQDRAHCPDPTEVIVVGEGMTPEEMRREMERLSRLAASDPDSKATRARWLNKSSDSSFAPITTVVPVPRDAGLAAEYGAQVARHAHRLREVFSRLGLAYQRQTRRVQGQRLDRARLPDAVTRGEVRILQARRLVVATDLFLGVLVDCSGSMQGDCMHKARLFATLVARAVQNLRGVDLRVLGFTDSLIYDAGTAHRCAAHNLQPGGGNNDAGALDFAATLARRSRRRARLLIMISDGLPTECSVQALSELVARLSRKERILCAQVAVRPLKEVCFPHYIELSGGPESLGPQVAEFGRIVARLASRALSGG